MNRRTFTTTTSAAAVGLASNPILTARAQAKAHATAEAVANTLITISQTHLITVAAVHGAAVAGGAGIMSACDFVVAAQRTKIGYPEVRRGLVAGLVMTFLRRQLGERNMRELLLGSELIDAERAKEIGLVNRVAAEDNLMSEALKFAESALQGAPGAVAETKELIDELWWRSVKQDIDLALKSTTTAARRSCTKRSSYKSG
jgi:methylglutaconyl-CoA hydratase